ncbi:MAG: arginase family protein [Thermoleophilia bacterium]|nr:arginase family protein [Thermoleophilia bacterium]
MSTLRARCPDCRTLTAVALGAEYECHTCGRLFAAGLVRVPRAWGTGGEAMAEAARLALPYPEAAVIDEPSLDRQREATASSLPQRPLVLGGCCCAHVGAVEELARRRGRLAVVWLDAHGDLNTSETSPSGNAWGMPLRMLLDARAVAPGDVALVGARNLDPPEAQFVHASGLHLDGETAVERAVAGADAVYVALDLDALDGDEVDVFMPEPGGLSVAEAERLLGLVAKRAPVAGAGASGLLPAERNAEPLVRLLTALGL